MPKIKAYFSRNFLFFFSLLLLAACTRQVNLDIDTINLTQLQSIRVEPRPYTGRKTELSALRAKSLQDSAMSIGAQAGLAWASMQMNKRMQRDRKLLDTIFNFDAMMLTHGVIPPVLEEGDFTLNLADPNTIRVADRTYKIVAQARFATTPPNWREYIWLSYLRPPLPDRTLLPHNDLEQKIWREGIQLGWGKGIEQAYSIFQQSLARLKRDYRGMVLYRQLLQKNMISQPFVARTQMGVTGTGSDMRINDQVLRIVELPQLQTNTKHWKAVIVNKNCG